MDIIDAYKKAAKDFEKDSFQYVIAVGMYMAIAVFLSVPIMVLFGAKMIFKEQVGAIGLLTTGYSALMIMSLIIISGGVFAFIYDKLSGKSPKVGSILLGDHIHRFFGLSLIGYFIYILLGFLPGQLAKGISLLNIAFLLPIFLVLIAVFLLMFTPFIMTVDKEDIVYAAPHSASFVLSHPIESIAYAGINVFATMALFLFPIIGWGIWAIILVPFTILAGFNLYQTSRYTSFSRQQKLRS